MSVGNLRDSGNKGNNFPYQLAVLKLLDAIANNAGAGGCPCPSSAQEITLLSILTKLTAVAATPSMVRVTSAAGSPIAAGAKSVSISNTGGANGLILGAVIKPGETVNWSAGDINNTLTAISYDGTGTELLIITVV